MDICQEGRSDNRLYSPDVPIGAVYSYNTNPKNYYLKAKLDGRECCVELISGVVYMDLARYNAVTVIPGCFKKT